MTSMFFAVKKFFCLPRAERRLLLKAMLLVWTVRVGLWLLPFRVVRRPLARLARKSAASQLEERALVDRVVWAVTATSRYTPAATCLIQALAIKVLLGRYGYPVVVRIGVARTETGELQAHAWVESAGNVIGDMHGLWRFTPLLSLGEE
jgi:hypothetical protein